MTTRLASCVFGAAVFCGWLAVWIAQSNAPVRSDSIVQSMSPTELQGVKRVQYDVPNKYRTRYRQTTLVLAGGNGDLRLSTASHDESSVPLELVRAGDTVFVRIKSESPQARAANTEDGDKDPIIYIDAPVTLALPESITELKWPGMRLMMAAKANMPALTLYSYEVHVGSDSRSNAGLTRSGDPQVIADLQGDVIPGRLEQLTIKHLQHGLCPGDRPSASRYSDDVVYEGGFFPRITLQTQAAKVNIRTMEPDMQLTLNTPSGSSLEVGNVAHLKQIQVQDLDARQNQELSQTRAMRGFADCDKAKGP